MILPGIGLAVVKGAGYPSIRGSVQVSTQIAGSTFSPTLPSHSIGDLLLVFFGYSQSSGMSATGWTEQIETTSGNNGLALYSRVATGSHAITIDIATSIADSRYIAHAYVISGTDGTISKSSAANIDPPSVSPSWGSDLTYWIAVASTSSAPATGPTGFGNSVQTTNGITLTTMDKNDNSATLNPTAFGAAGSNPVTMTVAVKPL